MFFIGCAENNEQLVALMEDPSCEYRWLLNSEGHLKAARDFTIKHVRIDEIDVPSIRAGNTERGYEAWYKSNDFDHQINREVKIEIEITTKKSKSSRDLSVYLLYPIRGLDITFNYEGINLRNVRETPFFAGRHPYPDLHRKEGKIHLHVSNTEWVFPTSGVTFFWDQ